MGTCWGPLSHSSRCPQMEWHTELPKQANPHRTRFPWEHPPARPPSFRRFSPCIELNLHSQIKLGRELNFLLTLPGPLSTTKISESFQNNSRFSLHVSSKSSKKIWIYLEIKILLMSCTGQHWGEGALRCCTGPQFNSPGMGVGTPSSVQRVESG